MRKKTYRQKTMNPACEDDAQSRAFVEKAREIEADEKHSAADKLMERLAKTKPQPKSQTKRS